MSEIRWENIATKFNYVLLGGKDIKPLMLRPERLMGNVYVTYINGETKNFTCDKWTLHERPVEETKPVYTQEMHNNDELPPVGCKFLVGNDCGNSRISDFNNKEVKVLALTCLDDDVLITFNHKRQGVGCGIFNTEWVKPIDNRTDEEKAIEDLEEYLLTYKDIDLQESYNVAMGIFDLISKGGVNEIKFTGNK